jgi:hypothetical protein
VAFAHSLELKKIKAGLLKSSHDPTVYDHGLARETAKEILSDLECEWHAIKNKLRQLVSNCGEE